MKVRDWMIAAAAFAAAAGAELLLADQPHGESWSHLPGFYAVFGFVVCLILAYFAKALGKYWLQRDERYYERWSDVND